MTNPVDAWIEGYTGAAKRRVGQIRNAGLRDAELDRIVLGSGNLPHKIALVKTLQSIEVSKGEAEWDGAFIRKCTTILAQLQKSNPLTPLTKSIANAPATCSKCGKTHYNLTKAWTTCACGNKLRRSE